MSEAESLRPDESALELSLRIVDPEVAAELRKLPEGPEREMHALRALRIGLLAMRQAAGAIDVDAVRREGDQILNKLKMQLNGHQAQLHDRLEHVLRDYFDPQSGRFAERVQSLVKKDGELERLLREQVGGEGSPLRTTLGEHFGPESDLMRALSPSESEGLLKSMEGVLGEALGDQRERILAQFSLDDQQSALARLVKELQSSHDDISKALQERVGDVVGEFSLDKEDSALSKLVARVDAAQERISSEFSLDQESSALARMKREMLQVFEKSARDDAAFRERVLEGLAELKGRKEEADRSTRHGLAFEAELVQQLQARAQGAGDVLTPTGNQTGKIPNSKVGDAVWELGPEHAAAGARIVIEAKESRGVSLADARAEIEVARKNRSADVGLFVFSAKTAPEGTRVFQRLGQDVFIVWDAADEVSDLRLDAGIETARALSARIDGDRAEKAADLEKLERAILAVEKQLDALDEIERYSGTIEKANDKIQDRVRKSRKQIRLQVDRLQDALGDLKEGA